MQRIFGDFLDGISESNDEPGMLAVMARAVSTLELHSFAYLAPPTASKAGTRLISTYPTSWTSHYLLQKYEDVDPPLRTRLRAEWNVPVLWPVYVLAALGVAIVMPGVVTLLRERR